MRPSYLLGIDIGTTATKVILCDRRGQVVAEASEEQQLNSPHPGWAEEDPGQWWENTIRGILRSLEMSRIPPSSLEGIGVSGMVPAMVLLDEKGIPLRPSIQQNDARTSQEIRWMKECVDENRIFALTGGSINQQTVGPKLRWLKLHEPEVFSRIKTLMGSYDYINYRLGGTLSLEQNWALESGLYHLTQRDWIDELLELVEFKREQLPPVYEPHHVVGGVNREAARVTGLREGTPIVAGSADHVASALAAGLEEEGDLLIKFGGAGDILFCLDTLDTDPRLFIDYHDIPGKFLLNGCMAASGSVLKWFVQEFCKLETREAQEKGTPIYELMDQRVETLPPGSEGLILLPYFLGEKTPILDPLARGVFLGLTLHHRKEHLYKAILEAVIYGFQHHIEVLLEKGHRPKKVIACNGGARSKLWLQIAADVIGENVLYVSKPLGSALGAAFVAGMGVGYFDRWSDIKQFITIDEAMAPNPERHARYQEYFKLYKAVYLDLKDRFPQLEALQR